MLTGRNYSHDKFYFYSYKDIDTIHSFYYSNKNSQLISSLFLRFDFYQISSLANEPKFFLKPSFSRPEQICTNFIKSIYKHVIRIFDVVVYGKNILIRRERKFIFLFSLENTKKQRDNPNPI